jgi:hypothetical protein
MVRSGLTSPRAAQIATRLTVSAEQLLNNRLQRGGVQSEQEGCNANKTNKTWSVRTGQGELANPPVFSHLTAPGVAKLLVR